MQTTAQERAARIVGRLDALFEIGRAAGTNRPGLGAGEQRAHDLVAGWMRDAGLDVRVDRAGDPSAAPSIHGAHGGVVAPIVRVMPALGGRCSPLVAPSTA